MIIRHYNEEDLEAIIELFYETVHSVNAKDYNKKQLDVWAPLSIDKKKWHDSFIKHITLVALIDDNIVGFIDATLDGYIDRLYVHKNYQNQKIATMLCDEIEKNIKNDLTTYASITAKPFFLKRGFEVVEECKVIRNGITLTNYKMIKYR